jgi:hypothetical protein
MIKIIDKRGTGKTSRLFLVAKENNGVIICKNPRIMKEKAYCYGITGLDFISYEDYWYNTQETEDFIAGRKVYIDELSSFLKNWDNDIDGYVESEEA